MLVTNLQEAHSQYSFMVVPKVFKHLTRKKVLTMEWMVGESPNDLLLQSGGFGNEKIDHPERQQLEAKKHLLNLVMLHVTSLSVPSYWKEISQ